MTDLENLANLDENTETLMNEHARLILSLQPSAANPGWSLEQPSPFLFVPNVTINSTAGFDSAASPTD